MLTRQQCSREHCRGLIFHTAPLAYDLAQAVIAAMDDDPSILDDLIHSQTSINTMASTYIPTSAGPSQAAIHTPSNTRSFDTSLLNQSFSPTPNPSTSKTSKSFCGNVLCRNKSGARNRGNLECSENLCRPCCQLKSTGALQQGLTIAQCSYRKHRVNSGGLVVSGLASTSLTLPRGSALSRAPVVDAISVNPVNPTSTSQSTTKYSQPVAKMWQTVSPGWIDMISSAGERSDTASQEKRDIVEVERRMRGQVNLVVYTEVSIVEPPFVVTRSLTISY